MQSTDNTSSCVCIVAATVSGGGEPSAAAVLLELCKALSVGWRWSGLWILSVGQVWGRWGAYIWLDWSARGGFVLVQGQLGHDPAFAKRQSTALLRRRVCVCVTSCPYPAIYRDMTAAVLYIYMSSYSGMVRRPSFPFHQSVFGNKRDFIHGWDRIQESTIRTRAVLPKPGMKPGKGL